MYLNSKRTITAALALTGLTCAMATGGASALETFADSDTVTVAEILPAKIAIIKADDFGSGGVTTKWTDFIDRSRSLGVKVSLGVVTERISSGDYSDMRELEAAGDVEFWNHGLDHSREFADTPTWWEFSNRTSDWMTNHMLTAQATLREALERECTVFGAPYNQLDATAYTVLDETSALNLLFSYGSPTVTSRIAVVGIISESGGTGAPDATAFKSTYPTGPTGPVSLQFHPASYDAGDLNEYADTVTHLLANGYSILLPSEYRALLDGASNTNRANLLTNPGFETGDTTDWTESGGSFSVGTPVHSGTYACRNYNRTATWNSVRRNINPIMTVGSTYRVGLWARVSSGTYSATLQIKVADTGGNHYTPLETADLVDTAWTLLEGTYTYTYSGTLSGAFIYVNGVPEGIDVYYDDAFITPQAANLLVDDFESYSADSGVPTSGPWAKVTFATARDESTATPFGSVNQYAELKDEVADDGIDLMSDNITAASGAVTTYSFDFQEPSTGGDSTISIGYAMEDKNTVSSSDYRVRTSAGNGTLNGVASAYTLDTAYRLYFIFNDSPSAVSYAGGTVVAGSADIWCKPLSGGTPVFAGTATANNSQTASYRVGFSSWSGSLQEFWIDNVSLDEGATDMLPPGDTVVWSDLATANIATSTAWAAATVSTNIDTTVLVWDTVDQGVGSTNDWLAANRLSLGAKDATEPVTAQITGLTADSNYVWRIYGKNSETNGWSDAVPFATALSAAQNPVFTNATALSFSAIQLGWEDDATTETDYLLYRSSGGSYQLVDTLPANTTAYQDDSVDASTTYTYRLAATNDTNGSVTDFAACQSSSVTTPTITWAKATGGTVTNYTDANGVSWVAHIFTDVGANALQITRSGQVEYLIVAGGGGGGASKLNTGAGGGGAGGLLEGTTTLTGLEGIVVGDGGDGGTSNGSNGSNGKDSIAFGETAIGGGGGASTAAGGAGTAGGSGGGGSNGTGGSGSQGNAGGASTTVTKGGGGGGAGGPGGIGSTTAGAGGIGVSSTITGTLVDYASGGDGNAYNNDYADGAKGAANTGNGGGGARSRGSSTIKNGGKGGSGIVVVRYQPPPPGAVLILR